MIHTIRHPWLIRLAALAVLVPARFAVAQAMAVAVDNPDAPDTATDKSPAFSVHKEQKPVVEAFEDFERYRDKKAWEKAFAALGKIEEGKPGRLVPDKDGFMIPTDLKVRAELLSLPPDGREAYRLFNDAKATQLLKDAADHDEVASLRKIVDRYFITSIGDQAADRLGDALFEAGDFPNAQRCWQMVVENFPDSALSPVLLQTKRAIALSRSGDWDQFEIVRNLLHDRYAGQTAHIAGADVVATKLVDGLRSTPMPVSAQQIDQMPSTFVHQLGSDSTSILPTSDQPVWQIPIMDAQAAAQLTAQLAPSGWGNMAGQFTQAIPATAVDERRIYVNWLGICFAADINTGKLLWRTDSFGDMTQKMAQSMMQGIMIDPQIYNITIAGDNLLCTRRSTDNQNYNELAMTRMHCLSADHGKAVWKSESGALSGWGFVGQPLVDGDHFYMVAHPQNSQELSLLCIGLARGDVRWQAGLGTPAASVNYRGMPTIPQPTLLLRSGKVMLLTNNGALLQIDLTSHQIDWSFGFPTNIEQQQQFYGNYVESPAIAPGTLLLAGPTLYFKECNSNLMFAMDASGPAIKWKRRIDPEVGIASFDGRNLLLAGSEIECIGNAAQVMQWDDKTTTKTGAIQPLIRGDWMYIFGSRGIESINLSTGETGPTFRGYDHDSDGGVLWKTSNRLVTVSCRAVTAYPLVAGHSN
jgi:outer membrane protein assembly factor BamB